MFDSENTMLNDILKSSFCANCFWYLSIHKNNWDGIINLEDGGLNMF